MEPIREDDEVAPQGFVPPAPSTNEPKWALLTDDDPMVIPAGGLINEISAKKKIDIPSFSGDGRDVLSAKNWLRKIKRLSIMNKWNDFETINVAVDCLQGDAWNWYESRADIYGLRANFEVFRAMFIKEYQRKNSYKGVNHIISMCEILRGENVSRMFDRINIAATEWLETITMPDRLPKSASNPEKIRQLVGYASLTDEEAALAYETGYKDGMKAVRNHLVESLYFRALPKSIADKLLIANLGGLKEIIQKAQELETLLQPEMAAVNAVSKKRQSTGPQNDAKKKMPCLYCKKKGHFQKECRKRIRENGKLVPIPSKVNEVADQKQEETVDKLDSLNF